MLGTIAKIGLFLKIDKIDKYKAEVPLLHTTVNLLLVILQILVSNFLQ